MTNCYKFRSNYLLFYYIEEAVASAVSDLASQSLSSAENLRQFRREVVELVKQQTCCALPLSKFIPTYHAHFGKQCRVSDYGFTRLQDLIEALRGVVHVVGEGPLRSIMLTHVIQVRRFTHDLLRLIKSEQKKGMPICKLPQIYEKVFNKVGCSTLSNHLALPASPRHCLTSSKTSAYTNGSRFTILRDILNCCQSISNYKPWLQQLCSSKGSLLLIGPFVVLFQADIFGHWGLSLTAAVGILNLSRSPFTF